MISEDGEWVFCDEPDCESKIKNHAWGHIKAEGWFFSRDGSISRCPDHLPEWFPAWSAWRKRKEGR